MVGIGRSWDETQCSHLEPIEGVPRCGSASCGAADGKVGGGAALSFCRVCSKSVAICVGSRSEGMDGGGRAISSAGAARAPFNAVSIDGLNRHSVTTQGCKGEQ